MKRNVLQAFDSFTSINTEGLTETELKAFLNEHKINYDTFIKLLGINTVLLKKNTVIIYKYDIKNALLQLINNKKPGIETWD